MHATESALAFPALLAASQLGRDVACALQQLPGGVVNQAEARGACVSAAAGQSRLKLIRITRNGGKQYPGQAKLRTESHDGSWFALPTAT